MVSYVHIYIFDRLYQVPAGLTILQALERIGLVPGNGNLCPDHRCHRCVVLVKRSGKSSVLSVHGCRDPVEPGMRIVRFSRALERLRQQGSQPRNT